MAERRVGKSVAGFGLAALAAWSVYLIAVRRWQERWGATDEEVMHPMPGDALAPGARDVSTRAVTIEARPNQVWPWLAQMGYQRGGMYSYDWIDQLLGVLEKPSSDEVLPQFQDLKAGDEIPIGSGPNWPVAAIEPNRSLVLDIIQPGLHISWSFGLNGLDDRRTRLVLRIRIRVQPWAHLVSSFPVFDFGQFLMTRKMLADQRSADIKERAEALARREAQGDVGAV
jgi:hypothetical protein